MAQRNRKRPLVVFEHGTRIYAPSESEHRYRIVARDITTGERLFLRADTEQEARLRAREIEDRLAVAASVREPDRWSRTVADLSRRYVDDYLTSKSNRYREKHEYLLRSWILPTIGDRPVIEWTSAESEKVLASVRKAGRSDALVQDVGSAMRALVTYARRLRWLTARDDDPMWLVKHSAAATHQGESAVYVPRSTLPTDEECGALFSAMAGQGNERWALAMRLVHRAGLRWGELTGLQAQDVEMTPNRVIHVRRAVEQTSAGPPTLKAPKKGKTRTAIFPKSLADDLNALADEVTATAGPTGLLFPNRSGGIARRSSFQQVWIKAADAAGWPMTAPLRRTTGYGKADKGWRWTGSAQWTVHDLRHVAACWMLFDLKLDPAVVAEKLGHADPAFTVKRYVGIRGNPDEQATQLTDEW
jgi:integrase